MQGADGVRRLPRRRKSDEAAALGAAVGTLNDVRVRHLTCLPKMVLEVLPARLPAQVAHIHLGARRCRAAVTAAVALAAAEAALALARTEALATAVNRCVRGHRARV